jgi:methyl-accepting chemotaxis protein
MSSLQSLLRRFTIATRMRGAIVMVLACFLLVGAAAVLGGLRLKSLNNSFVEHSVRESRTVADLRAALGDVRRWEKDMVINYEDGVAVLKARESWSASIKQTRKAFEVLLEGAEDEDNEITRQALERLDAYAKASEPVLQTIQNGGFDTAKVADRMLGRAKEQIAAVEQAVAQITTVLDAKAAAARTDFDKAMAQTLYAFGGVMLLVVLSVVPLTLVNSASIVAPMRAARQVAQTIASGDLTQPIVVQGKDEPAELLSALQAMQSSLRTLVGQVRSSTDSITTASSEIATGNQDLSSRTEQTASNLQQAASSMEQLTGTVKQSADSARQANQLAASAAEVAARGGSVVSQVVSTMDQINTSSKKIADIIGVIDGIAFQTNILALNAAVEAARAGEQGRGFAVVAGEVRNLAQRSAEAAKEIKGLIGTSVDKVESGSKLVADAGATMNEIVASVQRVTDIIGEITAAAAEQSDGIGQVNTAVTQLDQMTQQNAALVEESAAAAESLKDQAVRLAQVVGTFKLNGAAPGPAAPVMPATPAKAAAPTKATAPAPAPAARPALAPARAEAPARPEPTFIAPTPSARDDEWESF